MIKKTGLRESILTLSDAFSQTFMLNIKKNHNEVLILTIYNN